MDEKTYFLKSKRNKNKKKINIHKKKFKKESFNITNNIYIIIFIIFFFILIIYFIINKLKSIKKVNIQELKTFNNLNNSIIINNITNKNNEDNFDKSNNNIINNSSYMENYNYSFICNFLKIDEKKLIDTFKNILPQNERLFLLKLDNTGDIKKNQIHIAMAIDDIFIYPTLVSMTSALENNNKNKNIIIYHMLLSHNFNVNKIGIFESLKSKYEVRINYYIIPNIFGELRAWLSTETVYYKLLLPIIFHDFERIIYLDGDTLIFKDLLEMFNLPFNDNYVLGYIFHDVYKIDPFVKNAINYVNGGVLLFNIQKIRNENKDIELIKFTIKENSRLWFLEQDSINVIFYPKIGLFPLKYGIYLYGNIDSFEKSIQIRIRFKLNRTEVIEAIEDPSLVHLACCNPKVWNKNSRNEFLVDSICKRFHDEFYYYANKTNYYSEIYNKYMN